MESAESLSIMEDSDGRNEQITEIISMIKTTMASTEVPKTDEEATFLNLPFTVGMILTGIIIILVLILVTSCCLYQLYREDIEAGLYGSKPGQQNRLRQRTYPTFSATPVGRLEKLQRHMKFIEEVPLEERVKKQSNIQMNET
ncbi:hypothetical protein T01_4030 [Trichinella spiralis]|uniref:Uncharacterized protein n=1 Tax=Trichinella spiralis TaxID=6334 RepID=A0A0V1BPK2_TRISP|nr:hypothetical protein T01_4030 [Trichinella spiralis]